MRQHDRLAESLACRMASVDLWRVEARLVEHVREKRDDAPLPLPVSDGEPGRSSEDERLVVNRLIQLIELTIL